MMAPLSRAFFSSSTTSVPCFIPLLGSSRSVHAGALKQPQGQAPSVSYPLYFPSNLKTVLSAHLRHFSSKTASPSGPRRLWIKLPNGQPVKVPVDAEGDVADVIEAALLKLKRLAGVDADQITIHASDDAPAFEPDLLLLDLSGGKTAKTALIIKAKEGAGKKSLRQCRPLIPELVASAKIITDYAEVAAVERYTRLRDALREAEPVPIPSSGSGASTITLPDGVDWPQLGAVPLFL